MASARWYQAPAVDVRRGWESQWQEVADDLWDTVARIREAAPFPPPPQTEESADGGNPPQSPVPRPEGGGLAAADGTSSSTATPSPTAAFLENALRDAATPLVPERPSVPRAKTRQPLRARAQGSSVMQKRLWALVNDQRCASVDGDSVRAYEFAVQKLRGEFRQLVTASFAVLYDLGYEPPTDALDATVDAASGGGLDAPLGSDGSSSEFALPRTASVEDDDVPTAERVEALEWVLGVLVTLRRHCGALLTALKGPLRPLQGPMLAGPCAAQLLAEEVRRAFLHKAFFKALARAVASLEHPSRFTQPDTSSQSSISVPPSGLASSNAAILQAMVQLAQWAMQCGVREMVSCFADELKVRWAHAASQLVEGMSPELGPVATAAQLLGVIEHCDSLLRLLSAAIGGAHVSAVRAEVVQAVLCRDTVGLVVRSLFAAATKATIGGGPDANRLHTSATDGPEDFDVDESLLGIGDHHHHLHHSASRGSGGATDESAAALVHGKGDRLTPETEFGSFAARATPDHGLPRANAGPLATPGGTDANTSPATLMLMRVLVHGAGTDHVRDELALAVADVLYDSLGGARNPGAAATAGSPTGPSSSIDDRTITPVLHLLDAVALVRKVLQLGDVCIKKASLRTAARLRVTPASAQSGGSAAVAACCAEAVGEALVQVVGAHSSLFERVLADMLFGGLTGLGLDDLGDDLLALCERTRAADRFIENCKHVVASRFLRAPEVDSEQPTFAPATLPQATSPAANPAPPQRPPHGRATPHLRVTGGPQSCSVSNAAGGGGAVIAPSPVTFLLQPVMTVGASSLPTGSIAASEAGRGVTHAVEVHAALREWMPPEVIAPLTSLITEVNVAFFVNSDTVASPMNASAADLHELADDLSPARGVSPGAAAALGSKVGSQLELANAALEPLPTQDAADAAATTAPERPRYVAQCRCLASALWRPHLIQCAHAKADATVVYSVLALNQFPSLTDEMAGCMRWLESQYARAFPKRRLSWPALTGDVKLWFRLPQKAAEGDLATSASHGDWLTTPTKLPPRRSSVASGEWHLSDPGTAAMGGRQLRGVASQHTDHQPSNRTSVTVISTTPAVGHALLLFNSRPEMTLTDLKAAMLPLAPAVVERLAAYIVASGIIVSHSAALDDEMYLQVADTAPRSRRVALLSASWAVAAGDSDGAASERSDEDVGASAANTTDVAAMEAQLQSSRQRTVEAAMVRLLKRERACTIPELFTEVTASLRDRFPVEQRMLRTAVDVVVDREFAKRDDSVNPPLLVYVA